MVGITAYLEDYLVFIPVWSMEIIQLESCASATCSQDFTQNQDHASLPEASLQN